MTLQFSRRDRNWVMAESKYGIRDEKFQNWEEGTQHSPRKMGA